MPEQLRLLLTKQNRRENSILPDAVYQILHFIVIDNLEGKVVGEEDRIYLTRLYNAEVQIADHLNRVIKNQDDEDHLKEDAIKKQLRVVEKQFDINYPNQPISDYTYLVKADKVSEICKLISAFGTGITNFELVEIDSEKVIRKYPDAFWKEILATIDKRLAEVKKNPQREELGLIVRSPGDFLIITIDKEENIKFETIEFYHSAKDILFRLDEESDGTVRILDLLEILISGNGKTYVIDELDRCLHPSLTYKFVETYFEFAKERNIQLIVTTHESRLLDFDLLRRDEVWFVDKKQTGVSNIYSLEEYNARFDQKIDKAYLEGRYGGVPIFSTVFPVKED